MFFNTSHSPSSTVSSQDEHTHVDIKAIMEHINTILLTITVIFGVTGNSMVIWVAGIQLKPKVNNVWLVNLAIADLIFCTTRVASLIKRLFLNHWQLSDLYCRSYGFFKYANMFCSVFLLAVISLDRMICVCRPIFAKRRRTLYVARLVAVLVWITAILLSSPYFFYRKATLDRNKNISKCILDLKEGENTIKYILYLKRFLFGFVFPFLIILICYIMTGIFIKRTRLLGKSRPLRILVSLVIAFFLCWAPYHCLLLVKMVDEKNAVLKIWQPLANGFAYFNSCVNPLLYFFMGLNVKAKLKQSLIGICNKALADDVEVQADQTDDLHLDGSNS